MNNKRPSRSSRASSDGSAAAAKKQSTARKTAAATATAAASKAPPEPRKRPPQRKPTKTPDDVEATAEAESDEGEAEQESSPVVARGFWIQTPSWLVSSIVHASVLLGLAILTIVAPEQKPEMAIISSVETDTEDELDEVEFELDPADLEEVPSLAMEAPDPGAIDFGELAVSTDFTSTSIVGLNEVDDTAIGEIGALFGTEGMGMAEAGRGKGAASFFGVKTSGNRFIFVVDNSNSMGSGKFETAVAELMRSVSQLDKYQMFYVIFFSDTAYPLYYPDSAKRLVPATEENKRKLEYWLRTVHRCLRTDGEDAMKLALSMYPDAIYILGDGSFTDKTVPMMMALPPTKTTINTLGFQMKPQAEQGLRQIATKYKGKFTEVKVTPAMVELSKRMKRPKNNQPNGVWGIKLGQRKRKKNQ